MNAFENAVRNRYAEGGEVVSLDKARLRRQLAERTRRLSRRELAVLDELARGRATEQIAEALVLSPHTVRSHVKTAMAKLHARTRAHAVAIAISAGAIDAV